MRYLLDTHALFWWVYFPELLPPGVRDILANPDVRVFASAVSAYEMSYKHHRGRRPEVEPLVGAFDAVVAAEGFDLLPLSAVHAIRAGSYGPEHRDPFDRMLAAQAVVEGLTLVSKDEAIREMGADLVWE
ncbi:type II toxin-antitoxin system VapC family toxin [Mesorhizobium sp. LHD-90]|uniref:type II toxin-antitoxin system VapC family toxin n=1 Tax=Mesorhizobium sp. LHD-90 TaxID=3071414 RepID=UPI0027E02A34|nr:type II toxin-antitoxin system VapC family toxin [Mesorhizobium sp. LHD-90]MDQ6434876.1 type II toxin-antitoxin system VapC family toxin [Mesorhizobium sp. LHD-90]